MLFVFRMVSFTRAKSANVVGRLRKITVGDGNQNFD